MNASKELKRTLEERARVACLQTEREAELQHLSEFERGIYRIAFIAGYQMCFHDMLKKPWLTQGDEK